MAYLGIDPSLRSTGISLVSAADGKHLYSKQIKNDRTNMPESLWLIGEALHFAMNKCSTLSNEPFDGVAVETPFVGNNKLTTMKLSAVWGVVLYSVMKWSPGKIFEIHPTMLKRFVSGRANADKDQMLYMVNKVWGFKNACDDIVDAFGLAQLARCGDAPEAYSIPQQEVLRQYLGLKNAAGAEVE